MVSKKTKQAKKAAKEAQSPAYVSFPFFFDLHTTTVYSISSEPAAGPSSSDASSSSNGPVPNKASRPPSSSPEPDQPDPPEEGNLVERAEKVKEKGNVAFKAGKYQDAIGFYTKAIGKFKISEVFFPSKEHVPRNEPT